MGDKSGRALIISRPSGKVKDIISVLNEWQILILALLRLEYDPTPFFGVSEALLVYFYEPEHRKLSIAKVVWEAHTRQRVTPAEAQRFQTGMLDLLHSLDSAWHVIGRDGDSTEFWMSI